MRQLERLSIVHLGAVLAGISGERARQSGERGAEFADYRPYTPGDDLRRVDWNIYARLGEAFVKTAPSEGHISIALLIDASRSMDGEEDSARPTKFRHAQRLAAMLGVIALLRADAAEVHVLADGESWAAGRLSSPRAVVPLIEELSTLRRGIRTDLPASIRAYRSRHADAEVAVLLTDGLVDRESLRDALAELRHSAGTATLVHVVDDSERAVGFRGAVELRDRETGERMLVDVTTALSERYAASFERLAEQARAVAASVDVGYLRAPTSIAPLELLAEAARGAELIASETPKSALR
jgi:uncharacterized protein (DUF58 family)